ncbi:MAG TPA: thiamine ABC transporter substrate-binding protein, partial [Candidatus Limnocylindria bacterium]|nr:thiamine ABC transporter substrate-binding protein [Candidatus Limnocylindria bacterium]
MNPSNRSAALTIAVFAAVFVIIVAALSGVFTTPNPDAAHTPEPTSTPPPQPAVLTLLTHDSFAVTEDVLAQFESANNVSVRVLRAGDAGAMVNQAILTRDNPLADVLFGVDNTFLSRALDADIFEPYHAVGVDAVPAALRLDARERVTPIDYGDVCLNYDKSAYGATNPPPQGLGDAISPELTAPRYRSQLVVEDPGTSSPGLAFMLATIARFGETGDYTWLDYWADLRDNDVAIVSGWEEAYESTFSGGSGQGARPIVVSYATSPVAEVFYSDPQPTDAPTAVITDGCFRQVEFAGVLVGTKQPELARRLVEFMLTAPFQTDIPLNMFVFPAVPS